MRPNETYKLLHSKENHKQYEKTTLRMGENICKWSNWQRINLQNIQAAHAAQDQETNNPIQKWAEDLNRHFSKEVYRLPTNTWKGAHHHSSLEKCKSKLQWGITSQQSEWPSSKNLQTINAGEGVEEWEPSCTLGGSVNWYSHYGEQYGGSLKN